MKKVVLVNLDKNRSYAIEFKEDLISTVVYTTWWGQLGKGSNKSYPVKDEEEAYMIISGLIKKRRARGYILLKEPL